MRHVLTALIAVTLSGMPSLVSACAALCMPLMAHSAPAGEAIATEMPDCCPDVAAPVVDPAIRTVSVSADAPATAAVDDAPAFPGASVSIARTLHDPPVSPPAPIRTTTVLRI